MQHFRIRPVLLACGLVLSSLFATTTFAQTPVPYYANIKVKEANIRTGPSVKYPIQWVYQRKNWPVKVIATFETWRKINDIYGEAGWIHESLLSGQRYVIVSTEEPEAMYKLPVDNATIIQKVENGVEGKLVKCKNKWCQIEVADNKGWMKSNQLWGVE